MKAEEIKLGEVYACENGWLRRPIERRRSPPHLLVPHTQVKFEAGRDRDNLRTQPGWCSIDWFASKIITRL